MNASPQWRNGDPHYLGEKRKNLGSMEGASWGLMAVMVTWLIGLKSFAEKTEAR